MGGGTFNGTNELTIARTSDLVSVTGSVTLTEYDHDTDTFVNGNTLTVEFNVQNLAVFEPGPPPPAN
jgi:hypothetical protein